MVSTRCCAKKPKESKNHYELLGVSVDASGQEIKDAYRRLQKKYHPDIAGEKVSIASSFLMKISIVSKVEETNWKRSYVTGP